MAASLRSFFAVPVGEIEVAVPVVAGHVVFPGPDVIPDGAADRAVGRGHLVDAEPVFPEQA